MQLTNEQIDTIVKKYGKHEPVAVIGIGCRFPNNTTNLDEFWDLLINKVDAVGQIPENRFGDLDNLVDPERKPGKIVSKKGAFLQNIEQFDAGFFGISPKEAEKMDPHQRVLLEVAYEAIDDATISNEQLWGSNTSVFIGMWSSDWEHRLNVAGHDLDVYSTTGSGRYAASGRIAFNFNLQGTALTLDTACSSSLVAMHLAVTSLQTGQSEYALAGAANMLLDPMISIGYSRSGLLSSYGLCTFGNKEPGGYVRSEGAAMFLLCPLTTALKKGHYIHALIRGATSNCDGQSHNLMLAPSYITQGNMIKNVLKRFEINPADIQYIEAHGTGTKAGDSAELRSIPEALAPGREKGDIFYIGSIKSNIGHTESASGFAGAIKTILAIKNRVIPPNIHYDEPNPFFDWANLPLIIPTEPTPWPHPEKELMAGVNSFGITGTNAHIVFMEAPKIENHAQVKKNMPDIFPLSAHDQKALVAYATAFKQDLAKLNLSEIQNYGKNVAFRKNNLLKRAAVLYKTKEELINGLHAIQEDTIQEHVFKGSPNASGNKKVVFVFPGQGSQWQGMGKDLYEKEPVFKATIDACEQAFSKYVHWKLTEQLFETGGTQLSTIDVIQPAIVAIEVALAKLWMSWGVMPDAVVGHSMGEAASAYIAGAITIDEMANIICTRSKLMLRTSGKGAMGYAAITLEEALAEIKGQENILSIGVNNSPKSTVISGDAQTVEALIAKFESKGIFSRKVNVDVASHSPQMDPLKEELQAALGNIHPKDTEIAFYSTVKGSKVDSSSLNADYWVNNLRNMVQFGNTVQQLLKENHTIFIEMSPHPVLTQAVRENIEFLDVEAFAVGSIERNQNGIDSIAKHVATAFTCGVPVNWKEYLGEDFNYLTLPNYPWQKETYWIDESNKGIRQSGSFRRDGSLGHPLLMRFVDIAADNDTFVWETDINALNFPYITDHKVHETTVFPGAGYLEIVRAAVQEAFGAGEHSFTDIKIQAALSLLENETKLLQLTIKRMIGDGFTFTINSIKANVVSENWDTHCTGVIHLNKQIKSLNFNDFNTSGGQLVSKEQHYAFAEKMKLPYGEAFQTLTKASVADNYIEAEITSGKSIQAQIERYGLHPSVFDGCIQAFLLANYQESQPVTFVPTRVEKMQFYSTNGANIQCKIKIWIKEKNADYLLSDAQIETLDGKPIATFQGFRLDCLEKNKLASNPPDWLYNIQWQPISMPATITKEASALLICTPEALEQLKFIQPVAVIHPGKAFFIENGSYPTIYVDFSQEDHLRQAFDAINQRNIYFQHIIQACALSNRLGAQFEDFYAFQQETAFTIPKLARIITSSSNRDKPRLWVLTEGSQKVLESDMNIQTVASVIWGMGRTIDNEMPEIRYSRVDFPHSFNGQDVTLFHQLLQQDIVENEMVIRQSEVFGARLQQTPAQLKTSEHLPVEPAGNRFFEAVTKEPGLLSNIYLSEKLLPDPAAHEVQIEVKALGINFMNLMSALGIYPGKVNGFGTLGIECTGIVTKVGKEVSHLVVGDEVMGMAYHTMASHLNVPAALMRHKPTSLNFNDSATIPVVFLTSYYGLISLGRLKKGERVLIHAGTGGVGLSAIQIAQQIGAEIYATAGSETKRQYLKELGIKYVYDSRSLDFIEQIQADTYGEGVDVVLNSLTGEAMYGSISLLRNFGRFIEIGKKDVYENSRIGLEIFSKGLSYTMIDFEKMLFEIPETVGELLEEILVYFEKGIYRPLPTKVFPIADCQKAFEYMSKADHIGKIVVNVEDKNVDIQPLVSDRTHFLADATYLLTGGYGGLGLTFVDWMFKNGARRFVLTGRRGPQGAAQQKINTLIDQGAEIIIESADSADKTAWERILASIPKTYPLKGILHLSGILDDASLTNISDEQFTKVLKAKVDGAYHLHDLTKDVDLQLFVLFSSSSLLFGSPGQCAYIGANACLDALAQHRKNLGLEALSINWGTVSGVGLAAAEGNRGSRLEEEGIYSLSPEDCIHVFEYAGNTNLPVLGMFSFDPIKWQNTYPTAAKNPYFSNFRGMSEENKQEKQSFTSVLKGITDPQELSNAIEQKLKEKVSAVVKMPIDKIEVKTPFKSLGIDSLMSIQLKNQLEKEFEFPVSVTSFWTYPNIREYTKFMIEELDLGGEETKVVEKEPVVVEKKEEKTVDLDDISLDDISSLLDDELKNL
ncbi:MAG: SDR family NAD(P)-dependent oxidoreductase [Chitinophagales bacterium]|nr:SDR family NAD(P)-dependent oxidoreductase [Chitinophagales bacterium]